MDSKAYYLKYRPQKVFELDLLDVRQGLEKVLKSGKVPHALLFVGPRGTGKTSAARIFAKAINCEKRVKEQESKRVKKEKKKDFEPCNRCSICQEITVGSALDLIEIDAASNRGIDDIRHLREKIKLSPTRAKYKVYIVDEAHMLTTEAFNALLKTLEEPPVHAVFILCTTAPEKLPKTIISRCLRFNFKKAKVEETITALKRAVKGEKLILEKGALDEIARSVDGSFRDAHKILEQLSFTGRKISLKEAKEVLGKIEALEPEKLLMLLAARNAKPGLQEIDRVVKAGGEMTVYLQEILDRLRLAWLAKLGLDDDASGSDSWYKDLSLDDLRVLIQLFSRAAGEMKTNPIPQLPLELAVVEWCEDGDGAGAARRNFDSASDSLARNRTLINKSHRRSQSETSQNLSAGSRQGDSGVSLAADQNFSGETSSSSEKGDGLGEIKKHWDDLLAGVRPLNHSVEALLRAARPAKMEGDFLTLEVFYKFHKERLETEKCRSVVEEVAAQILGSPIKIRCVLGNKGSPEEGKAVDKLESETDIIKTAEDIFGVDTN